MDGEEEICAGNNGEFEAFDKVIGTIEDIVVGAEYRSLHDKFLETYWMEFDTQEENKLIYMELFRSYCLELENFLTAQLREKIPGFRMETFLELLRSHKSSSDGEIFDLLLRFTDFLAFKEMMLDYKAVKEGHVADLTLNALPHQSAKK